MLIRYTIVFLLIVVTTKVEALISARLDDPPQYPAVVVMLIGDSGRCSATKIAARQFLTAAHCVADFSTGTISDNLAEGQPIRVSNAVTPTQGDFVHLHVKQASLHPDFEQTLKRFHAYKETIINEYRKHHEGVELERRIRRIEADNHIEARNPDLAVVSVDELTPRIPIASIDFAPLKAGESVHLVGFGCEVGPDALAESKYGRRHWGETRVIRIDAVNFYTFAHKMRSGAPSICPGDSGGPVMRAGKIVGVHGTAYGLSENLGANSNMSVNLRAYKTWSLLH
jgi:hypothetical protein